MAIQFKPFETKLFIDGKERPDSISEVELKHPGTVSRKGRRIGENSGMQVSLCLSSHMTAAEYMDAAELRFLSVTLASGLGLRSDEVVAAIEKHPDLRVVGWRFTYKRGMSEDEMEVKVDPGEMKPALALGVINRTLARSAWEKRKRVEKEGLARAQEEERLAKMRRESRQFMEVLRLGELGGGNSRQIRKRSRAAARSLGIAWATIQGRAS